MIHCLIGRVPLSRTHAHSHTHHQLQTVERQIPVVGTGGTGGKGTGGGFNPAIHDEEEKKEFFDDEKELARKLDRTVTWMKQSKHVIIFTGAGVSTRYASRVEWAGDLEPILRPPSPLS